MTQVQKKSSREKEKGTWGMVKRWHTAEEKSNLQKISKTLQKRGRNGRGVVTRDWGSKKKLVGGEKRKKKTGKKGKW